MKRATEVIKSVTKWVKDNEKWLTMLAAAVGAMVLAVKAYNLVVKAQKAITTAMTTAAVSGRTTPGDLTLLSIAVWGFLGTCCTSTAETIHSSGVKLNGFETWRRLCRHIDMGASLHLEELRSAVRHVVLKPIRRLEDVALGVIEFEQTFRRHREA